MTTLKRYRSVCLCTFLVLISILSKQAYSHSWMAPHNEAQKRNPIESTIKSVQLGKELYEANCIACHGEKAKGLPVERSGLNHATPNLVQRLKGHSDGDFHWKIRVGKNEMPSFKEELLDDEIWTIINYIKQLE